MKKFMFIINGAGGTGKDKFIECCSKLISTRNISSVDHIKDALEIICPTYEKGLEKQQNEDGDMWRQSLHDLKMLSAKIDDGPFKVIMRKIYDFFGDDNKILFIHIREPEEIKKIVKCYNCKTILFKNYNARSLESLSFERNVVDFNYDIIIHNDGSLDDLMECAEKFVSEYC